MPQINPAHIVLMLLTMILSLSFHEFAHALIAKLFGDDTAQRQGRLTLNPVAHVDPVGTLLLPALGATFGVPLIGWAKPVPVNPARFRPAVNRRRAFAVVSLAGPLSNLLLAVIAVAILRFGGDAVAGNAGVVELLISLFRMNLGLCVFNLLPLAPLDGSRLTPRFMDGFQAAIAPYSMFILMGILMIPMLRALLIETPIRFLAGVILSVLRFPRP